MYANRFGVAVGYYDVSPTVTRGFGFEFIPT